MAAQTFPHIDRQGVQESVVLTFHFTFQMLVCCVTLELVTFFYMAVRKFISNPVHIHLWLHVYTCVCQHDISFTFTVTSSN